MAVLHRESSHAARVTPAAQARLLAMASVLDERSFPSGKEVVVGHVWGDVESGSGASEGGLRMAGIGWEWAGGCHWLHWGLLVTGGYTE